MKQQSNEIGSPWRPKGGIMVRRCFNSVIVAGGFGLLFIWSGCSGSDRTFVSSGPPINSSVENYFPVASGAVRDFRVTEANGAIETITFEVGSRVLLGSKRATEWFVFDGSGNRSTSYVTTSPSAIVFYENADAPGETILALPLKAGESWERYGNDSPGAGGGNIFTGLVTGDGTKGNQGVNDSTQGGKYDGSILGKNFPTDGTNTLSVNGFETVVLSNGATYTSAVKLVNGGLSGVNYYWFAPGVGLVKYVLRGQPDGSEAGATVGELRTISSR